jgi:cytochrome b
MTQISDQTNNETIEQSRVSALRIWDLPIRIFHWLLVLLFVAAYTTHILGTDYFIYHLWFGYV